MKAPMASDTMSDTVFSGFRGLWGSFGTLAAVVLLTLAPALAMSAGEDCLTKLKTSRTTPADAEFDKVFDEDRNGRSFSCVLGVRASEARRALAFFAGAILYDREREILRAISFPLDARVFETLELEQPTIVHIRNATEWLAFKRRYLNRYHIALAACGNLRNVDVVAGRTYGYMLGNGMFWFQKPVGAHAVKVTAINIRPMDAMRFAALCAGN